jgi:glycosyltransferase involved in cell wall biosynthesis
MNLLFVTDVYPFPPYSGSAVISFHWIRHLVLRHNVALISALPPEDAVACAQLRTIGVNVVSCSEPLMLPRGAGHAISWMPMAMHRVRLGELVATVERAMGLYGTDVVVAVGPAMATLLRFRRRLPRVVFVPYDSESLNFKMRSRYVRGTLRRMYFRLEDWKWQLVEAHLYPLADACVAVSREDARSISRRWRPEARARIRVIPNGVDTAHFHPLPDLEVASRIVLSGNMDAIETEASVTWFLRAVLPGIRRRGTEATVEVVGRNPGVSLRRLAAEMGGVNVRGYVPDLRPYLASASVYAAPLRLGSGVKNRVLEAMAMARPVVATPLGVRGLEVRPGCDVVVAAQEDIFAEAVVRMLQDRAWREEIGRAARETILARHSWGVVMERVEALIRELSTPVGKDGN